MALEVYLIFNGNCREAIEFYAKVFETEKPYIQTYGEVYQDNSEFNMPEEAKNLIMHANLNVRGSRLIFSDTFPGNPYTIGNNITVAFIDDDLNFMKRAFEMLKEGGKVEMELQKTFWSKAYGSLTDKFGVNWQFNHESKEQ